MTASPFSLIADDPAAADPARARLAPKSRLPRILSLPSLFRKSTSDSRLKRRWSHATSERSTSEQEDHPAPHPADFVDIRLDSSRLSQHTPDHDIYEWAVLYENQRGMTVFSVPYYSPLSLLPHDPSPFTVPSASLKRTNQPPVSLANYPLPDGDWHWVSRTWMIDMRSDSGEVQHDGFEYNWMFRRHHWRAQVGPLSAGGWVRRRRWVRLMTRPAKPPLEDRDEIVNAPTSITTNDSERQRKHRYSLVSSLVSSMTVSTDIDPEEVWEGADAEADWQRCRKLMRKFGTDGRILEVWRSWLGYYHPDHKHKFTEIDDKGKRREKQWTEDEGPMLSEATVPDTSSAKASQTPPPLQYIIPVLRKHGPDLLRSFTFPESRAQFLQLLALAGALPELNVGLGIGFGASEVDFWSYVSDLGEKLGVADVPDAFHESTPPIVESPEEEEQQLEVKKSDEFLAPPS